MVKCCLCSFPTNSPKPHLKVTNTLQNHTENEIFYVKIYEFVDFDKIINFSKVQLNYYQLFINIKYFWLIITDYILLSQSHLYYKLICLLVQFSKKMQFLSTI